jgi:hypothetical protein
MMSIVKQKTLMIVTKCLCLAGARENTRNRVTDAHKGILSIMNIPETRVIKPGGLYRALEPLLLPELKKQGKEELMQSDFLDAKVLEITAAWRPYEEKVLHGMSSALDLEFKQNLVEIHILPLPGAFSWPLTIGEHYFQKDRAVDTICHELIHRLLIDNTKLPYDFDTWPAWRKIIGEEHNNPTFIHIVVHAVLKHLFLDVLQEPERLARDIADCQQYENYKAAWDYVESHDYMRIVDGIRRSYDELATTG